MQWRSANARHSLTYYAALMDINELALSIAENGSPENETHNFRPALAHSTNCFETIMRLYYLHHGYDMPDGQMSHNLVVLAYKGLSQRNMSSHLLGVVNTEAVSEAEATSTLILAQRGLYDQAKNYFLPWALFQIVEGEMSPEDRNALQNCITIHRETSETLQAREKYMSSNYPVGLATLSESPESRRLGQLTNEFTELAKKKAKTKAKNVFSYST